MNASDEWELSKENVQPLKHGRKVTSLTAALQPHNVDQHQQLILQRQTMEAALRSYAGDDPLAPWDEYIKWTEQAYPNGGKDSNLQVLLEKCLAQFKKDARYRNDTRYVGCWIKLANSFVNNPLEIFQFMRDQAIGTGLSIFYEAWSWELEQHGNTKKADAVYREGLACHAHPKDRLEAAHRDFQSRVARATLHQMQDGDVAAESQADQREHLGGLRAKGRHQKVGSQRVGSAKQPSKGGLGVAVPAPQVGQSFSVFCDDAGQSSLPAPTGEWERMPNQQEAQKENVQAAGPWAGQKVRQHRSAGIAIGEVATFAQPSFQVHVDESGPDMTPRQLPEMGSQVLSARKPEKPSNLLQNMAQQPVADDKTKAMYCKHLIYNGANEMSFEELRTIKYNARREAKKMEEDRLALERQRAEYQAMVKQQQEAMEQQLVHQRLLHQQQLEAQRLAQQQMQQQIQQQMQQQIQQQQHQMRQQLEHMQLQLQRQPPVPPKQVPDLRQRPAQVQLSVPLQRGAVLAAGHDNKPDAEPRDPTVTRQLVYEETGNQASWMDGSAISAPHHQTPSVMTKIDNVNAHLSTSQMTPGSAAPAAVAPAAPGLAQSRTPVEHAAFPAPAPTPGSSHSRNTSGLSLSRLTPSHTPGGLTRPSPTVHTKEAMSVVMAMLNNPLGEDDDFMWGDRQQAAMAHRDDDFEAIFANADAPKSKPPSFPDFRSTNVSAAVNPIGNASSAGLGFTIFNESEVGGISQVGEGQDELNHLDDQENMPPRDYVRPVPDGRPKLGILQPAQGIPFMSLEDQDKEARALERESSQEMDGVKPLPVVDENLQAPDVMAHHAINETILDHQGAHSAFKTASRMASTPFNSTGVPSFSPVSSIKPSLLGADTGQRAAPHPESFVGSGGRGVDGRPETQAGRIVMGLESFEAAECTINADSQQPLSPIMERSNEDARSSASSCTNSTGSLHLCSTTHAGASSTSQAGLSGAHPSHPASNVDGLPPSHPGISTSHAGLATRDSLSVTPQAPASFSKCPSSTSQSGPTRNPCDNMSAGPSSSSMSRPSAFNNTSNIPSSTRSSSTGVSGIPRPSYSTNLQMRPSPMSLPSTSLNVLDTSNVSLRRGLTSRHGTDSSFQPCSGQTNKSANGSFFDISREADHSLAVDHQRGATSEFPVNNPLQSFSIFDDSTQLKPSGMPTTSGSFQVFEDECPTIGPESRGAPSQPSHDVRNQENNFNLKETFQMRQADDKPVPEPYANKIYEASVLEGCGPSHSEKPMHYLQSFQIFDESASLSMSVICDPAQPSRNEQARMPASSASLNHEYHQPQQHTLQDSMMMEVKPPDVSLSTSLMSKMHLAKSEDSFMEASHHHNVSLMDYSQAPDGPEDVPAASHSSEEAFDPFSEALKARLLEKLARPLSDYEGYYEEFDYPMPDLVLNEAVGLSDEWYTVEKLTGEGAFAKIYQASIVSLHTDNHSRLLGAENDKVVLKVQKPSCPWEFYISRTLHERLDSLRPPVDVKSSLMYASDMHVFPDGSCLVTQHHRNLTLLDAVNEYSKAKGVMPEPLLLLFTIEILHVVEQMHACGIIHGDIKPDNFLLLCLDVAATADDDEDDDEEKDSSAVMTSTKHVKLIDFGRSIDMRLLPAGTTFTATCDTAGFMCPEMLRGKPWTYQTDLFGVAATVHCLMFGSYMKVYEEKGHWKHTSNIKRCYLAKWKQFFDTLLNVPGCGALPSLGDLRRDLEKTLVQMGVNLDAKLNKLVTMLTMLTAN